MQLILELDKQSATRLQEIIRGLAPDILIKEIFALFEKAGARMAAHIIATKLSGDPLKRRTGSLARSVVGGAIMRGNLPTIRVGIFRGPSLAYAAMQEYGGTILPKNAKALALPVNDALTPAGVARYPSPRNYPSPLRFVPWKGAKAIGALYDADQLRRAKQNWAAVRPLWILMSSVDMPGKHYLMLGMREALPLIAKDLLDLLRNSIRGTAKSA